MALAPGKRLRGRAGVAQRLRRLKRTNGLCEHCLAEGLTRPADVVDHTRPLALGGLDVDANTRNLCEPHHKQVTIEQFGHQVAHGARGVTTSGRPISADHAWNLARRPADLADPPRPRRRPAEAPGGRK